MKKKSFGLLLICFIIVAAYFFFAIFDTNVKNFNALLIMSFSVNIILAVFKLVNSLKTHSFSMQVVFWLFNSVFFGLAPLIQYLTGWRAWELSTNDDEMLICNGMIFIWYISFIIGSHIKTKITIGKRNTGDNTYSFITRAQGARLCIVVSIVITVFLLVFTGIDRLFFRGANSNSTFESSALSILSYHVFRNFVLYTFVILLVSYKSKNKNRVMLIIALCCFAICCFPTGLSRYMIAAFYLGVLIQYIRKEKCNTLFFLLIFAGIVIVFPALDVIRYLNKGFSIGEVASSIPKLISNAYLSGNFDAYQMIISGTHYINQYGYSYGYQVLGVLLFFIPRSIWPNKPIGTGELVIKQLNQFEFSNVSMSLLGESYFNFGYVGIIIVGIILGYVIKRVDDNYWNDDDVFSFRNITYPVLMFYFFFMQRGDLLSTGSYFIANYVMGYLVWKLMVSKQSMSLVEVRKG